ncbi:unnamed protein product [Closterium sp. NIES-54]
MVAFEAAQSGAAGSPSRAAMLAASNAGAGSSASSASGGGLTAEEDVTVLESQARAWIERVLARQLPADRSLPDILEDGQTLIIVVPPFLHNPPLPSPAPPPSPHLLLFPTSCGNLCHCGQSSTPSSPASPSFPPNPAVPPYLTHPTPPLSSPVPPCGVQICRSIDLYDINVFTAPDVSSYSLTPLTSPPSPPSLPHPPPPQTLCGVQICRSIGLYDVNVFTPPDLVERRDLRRVYLCLRTLSKRTIGIKVSQPSQRRSNASPT